MAAEDKIINLPIPIHSPIVKDNKPTVELVSYLSKIHKYIAALEARIYALENP